MSKGMVKIKLLRQNFIKKHQLEPEYFTKYQHNEEENYQFCDKELFYPDQIHHKRNLSAFTMATLNIRADFRSAKPKMSFLHKKTKQEPVIRPKSSSKKQISQEQKSHLKFSTYQPSFIKTQKLRRQIVSARQRPVPKYAVQIMKLCNVEAIKIVPRPSSAFSRNNGQLAKLSAKITFRQNHQSPKIVKKRSLFQPWETIQDQF